MALALGLACCCGCPGFCNDLTRAILLITLKGIAGTRPTSTNCPTCDFLNQTYPLAYRADGEPFYSLQCAPYADMVTACLYSYRLQCDNGKIELHAWVYTTAGGDRRCYVEVRFFGFVLWIQKADFLMASGTTEIECASFTVSDEALAYCNFIGTPGDDCDAATAIDMTIEAP